MADDESSGSDRESRRPQGWRVITGNYGIRKRKNRLPERRVRERASRKRAKDQPSVLVRLPKERRKKSRRRDALKRIMRGGPPMRQSMRELRDSLRRAKPETLLGALEGVTSELRSMCPEMMGIDPNG